MADIERNGSKDMNSSSSKAIEYLFKGKDFDSTEWEALKINILPLVFTFIFAVLGFIGNSIVIYIYWTKWKKNKTRVFILTLGMLDWINCVFNMPVEIAILWYPLTFNLHYLCKISRGCTYVINNTGSLVLVSIAIERYLLVYYPLKNRSLTPKVAKVMCLLAFVIATVFSWPSFVFYGSHTLSVNITESNVNITESKVVVGKTCLIADEHDFRTGLLLIFTTVLFALLVLTFVVLTALYVAIGRKIYIAQCSDFTSDKSETVTRLFSKSIISALTGRTKSTEQNGFSENKGALSVRSAKIVSPSISLQEPTTSNTTETDGYKLMSSGSSENPRIRSRPRNSRRFSTVNTKATRKNTVMMRMVTIAFMVSFTPFLCILIIRYTNPMYYLGLSKPAKIAYQVFLRTYFINSMVNPFIYGFMNLHFRKMVKDLFRKMFCSTCCRRKQAPLSRR